MKRNELGIIKIINLYRIAFAQNSPLYKYSLNKKYSILDESKFLESPWKGNIEEGQRIISNGLVSDETHKINRYYILSFSWLIDLQAIGWHKSRKLAREFIKDFILEYRSKKFFWKNKTSWDLQTVSDRLINWMFSYTFFASGSKDKFQRLVLSSMAEQYHHLLKSYKAELDYYKKLIILRTIFIYSCSLKKISKRKINSILKDIKVSLIYLLEKNNQFELSPYKFHNILKILLEIRFMAQSQRINIDNSYFKILQKLASTVRFFRHVDGGLSKHLIQKDERIDKQLIDSTLSILDSQINQGFQHGFDKLVTKNVSLIINTIPRQCRSCLNRYNEPGLNVFDFDASVRNIMLINRADIACLIDKNMAKINKHARISFNQTSFYDYIKFVGEVQYNASVFNIAMRRDINVSTDNKIYGTDFVRVNTESQTYCRFALNQKSELHRINQNKVAIVVENNSYMFTATSDSDFLLAIDDQNETPLPTINFIVNSKSNQETVINWIFEEKVA